MKLIGRKTVELFGGPLHGTSYEIPTPDFNPPPFDVLGEPAELTLTLNDGAKAVYVRDNCTERYHFEGGDQ